MRKLSLIIHISLDGFVAAPNGDLSWFTPGEENLQFVCGLTKNADAALFGRTSFELLHEYWPTAKDKPGVSQGEIDYSTWYNNATKIVVSKTMKEPADKNIVVINENIIETIQQVKQQNGKDILIFGSPALSRELMQYDLIDDYWIFINPILFGKGIALFRSSNKRTQLTLTDIKRFGNGEVAMHYVNNI